MPAAQAAEDVDPAVAHQSAFALTLFFEICATKLGRPLEAQATLEALPLKLARLADEDLPALPVEPGSAIKAWAVASPIGPVLVALIDSHLCIVQAVPVDGPGTREQLDTVARGMARSPTPFVLEQHEIRTVPVGDQEVVLEYWVLDGRPDGVKLMFVAIGPGESTDIRQRWMRLSATFAK